MQLFLGEYKFEHHFLDYLSPFYKLLTTGLTRAGWENSHTNTSQILQLNGDTLLCASISECGTQQSPFCCQGLT